MSGFPLPSALKGKCSQEDYSYWIATKAATHSHRDKKRGNKKVNAKQYKEAIHKAVCDGGDRDAYTGKPLKWNQILTYDNAESKKQGRKYKKKFGDLPTVDRVGDGMGAPRFRICAWRTNDCKNDLSLKELIKFCEEVLAHKKKA